MRIHLLFLAILGIILLIAAPRASANDVAMLWGIDEDQNELFSIEDYTKVSSGPGASGLTVYGPLKYDRDVSGVEDIRVVGNAKIGSFTIDRDSVAYMVLNDDLDLIGAADLDAPVLLKFDLANATTGGDNVVEVIGSINIPGFDEPGNHDNISGLSIDPTTGDLYALYRVSNTPDLDELLLIDKSDASVITNFGNMTGAGEAVEDGEDLEFDADGVLYVTDDEDNHLYRVDPSDGTILEVVDNNQPGGLDGNPSDIKTEGLGWDPVAGQMVATDDNRDEFFHNSLGDGNNTTFGSLGALTDVEAIDFLIPGILPEDGRVTGGGHQISVDGARVTRGFTLHCDNVLTNNLEINWRGGNKWHITKNTLTPVDPNRGMCFDEDGYDAPPPVAPVDTIWAFAIGEYNGSGPSMIMLRFEDHGEPGKEDVAKFKIWSGLDMVDEDVVLEVDGIIDGGNIQFHFDQPHK